MEGLAGQRCHEFEILETDRQTHLMLLNLIMNRLNNRAFELLGTEVQRCTGDSPINKVEQEIVLKRLRKLRSQQGDPVKLDEVRDNIVDVLPQFSEKVLKQAVKVNQPPGIFSKVAWRSLFLGGFAGIVWVINLHLSSIKRIHDLKVNHRIVPSP